MPRCRTTGDENQFPLWSRVAFPPTGRTQQCLLPVLRGIFTRVSVRTVAMKGERVAGSQTAPSTNWCCFRNRSAQRFPEPGI